jgi:hypothetical protein
MTFLRRHLFPGFGFHFHGEPSIEPTGGSSTTFSPSQRVTLSREGADFSQPEERFARDSSGRMSKESLLFPEPGGGVLRPFQCTLLLTAETAIR